MGAVCFPMCPPRVALGVALSPTSSVSPAALSCFVVPREQPSLASSKQLRVICTLVLGSWDTRYYWIQLKVPGIAGMLGAHHLQ